MDSTTGGPAIAKTRAGVGIGGSLYDHRPSSICAIEHVLSSTGIYGPVGVQALLSCIARRSGQGFTKGKQMRCRRGQLLRTSNACNCEVVAQVMFWLQGDINIAHREIDHCDPNTQQSKGASFADHPCRRWLDSFLGQIKESDQSASSVAGYNKTNQASTAVMVDAFRHLHPYRAKAFTVRTCCVYFFWHLNCLYGGL